MLAIQLRGALLEVQFLAGLLEIQLRGVGVEIKGAPNRVTPIVNAAPPPVCAALLARSTICVLRSAAPNVRALPLAVQGAEPVVSVAVAEVCAAPLACSVICVASAADADGLAMTAAVSAMCVLKLALPPVVALADADRPCPFAVRTALDAVVAAPVAANAILVVRLALEDVEADAEADNPAPFAVKTALDAVTAEPLAASAMLVLSAAVVPGVALALAASVMALVSAAVLAVDAAALAASLIAVVRLADAADVAPFAAASVMAVESAALEFVDAALLADSTAPPPADGTHSPDATRACLPERDTRVPARPRCGFSVSAGALVPPCRHATTCLPRNACMDQGSSSKVTNRSSQPLAVARRVTTLPFRSAAAKSTR